MDRFRVLLPVSFDAKISMVGKVGSGGERAGQAGSKAR